MTKFKVLYEQFLSLVSLDFGELSNEEIEQELESWVILAAGRFKFPRIPLDFIPSSEGVEAHFTNKLTQREITVIIEYMKLIPLNRELNEAKRYESYYNDANLKKPSQSAMLTQINRSVENQSSIANRVELDYYRVDNGKPTIGRINGLYK